MNEDNALLNHFRKHPFSTAAATTNFPDSSSTICRRVKGSELKYRVATKKPLGSVENMQAKLSFALNFAYRDMEYWDTVIFMDEKVLQSY